MLSPRNIYNTASVISSTGSAGGRLTNYVRVVCSLIPAPRIINKNYCSVIPAHKKMHCRYTNSMWKDLGEFTHSQNETLKQNDANYKLSNSPSSPEEYFKANGKFPPEGVDISSPDVNKPATSICELLTMSFVSALYDNRVFRFNNNHYWKKDPLNFSNQTSSDCIVTTRLSTHDTVRTLVDCKTMNTSKFFHILNSPYSVQVPKLQCNLYFVGGIEHNYIFNFVEMTTLVNLIDDRIDKLKSMNHPVINQYIHENEASYRLFKSSRSILDLQKVQIAPVIFSQSHFSRWWNYSLVDYPK